MSTLEHCQRCKQNPAAVVTRSEHLCSSCFQSFVKMKVLKSFGRWRTWPSYRDQCPRFLLPISFGNCSLCLFSILHSQLERQKEHAGQPSFSLLLAHIEDRDSPPGAQIESLQRRYPSYELVNVTPDANGTVITNETNDGSTNPDILGEYRESSSRDHQPIRSATSKKDLQSTVLHKSILSIAAQNGCHGILWGDTSTRLAARIFSDTAKGNAFSIPEKIGEEASAQNIDYIYPLRDLLKTEVLNFRKLSDSIDNVEAHEPSDDKAIRMPRTIDDLMSQYFENIEKTFPNIVANVVRSSTRLERSYASTSRTCVLCDTSFFGEAGEVVPYEPASPQVQSALAMCPGCLASSQDELR